MSSQAIQKKHRPSHLVPELPLVAAKQLALALATERRRDKEYGGFMWRMLPIDSSPAGRARLTAAAIAAKEGWRRNDALWKFADGSFRPVGNRDVIELARAVTVFVQACFDEEAAFAWKINGAGSPEELSLILDSELS